MSDVSCGPPRATEGGAYANKRNLPAAQQQHQHSETEGVEEEVMRRVVFGALSAWRLLWLAALGFGLLRACR
jgi:hypothetical protein